MTTASDASSDEVAAAFEAAVTTVGAEKAEKTTLKAKRIKANSTTIGKSTQADGEESPGTAPDEPF